MLSRRRYLTAIGTTSAIGLAGCSGDGSDGSESGGGDDGDSSDGSDGDGSDGSDGDGSDGSDGGGGDDGDGSDGSDGDGSDGSDGHSSDDSDGGGSDSSDGDGSDGSDGDGSDGGDDDEDCDDEACDQVTERLTEVTSTGTVDDGQIDAVELTLRPRLGEADSIDLDGVTIELITADTVFALVSDQVPSPPGDGVFSYRPIRDANSSISQDGRVDDEGDMVLIMLGLDGAASANGSYVEAPLDAGDEPLVRIVTPEGAEAGVPLIVPDVLSGEQTVEL